MATDRASRTREHRTPKEQSNPNYEPYVSWKVDFLVLFALAVLTAGVLASFLVL